MDRPNLIRRIQNKIRPGSQKGFTGTSIVDTVSKPNAQQRGITPIRRHKELDPESVSWPVALTEKSNVIRIPRGILPEADEEGNLPRYEPDDSKILARLFNIRG